MKYQLMKCQKRIKKIFLELGSVLAVAFLFTSTVYGVGLSAVSVDGGKLPKPRWMYSGEKGHSAYGVSRTLERIKKDQIAGRYAKCVQRSGSLGGDRLMAAWALSAELDCATKGVRAQSVRVSSLVEALGRADQKSQWMVAGAQKKELRKNYIEGRLVLAELDQKQRRHRSWRSIDRLFELQEWLSEEQKIQLLLLAGDLSFIEQKMEAAKRFTLQSLEIKESSVLREKLSTIEKAIAADNKASKTDGYVDLSNKNNPRLDFEAQLQEEKLYESVQSLLKGGDLLSATEDAVRLIKQFPGGRRADWASDQILNSYLKVDTGSSKNYFSEQSRMIRAMSKVDGLRLQKWAEKLFTRGRYFAAKEVAKTAVEKLGPAARTRRLLMLAGEAALASGEVREAADFFADVAKKHSGSKESFQAIFRAGLAYYRLKEFSKAVAFFERMLVINDGSSLELSSRYWYWRSLQKIKSVKAKSAQDDLIEKFPLTYYGLRAAAEKTENKLKLSIESLEAPENSKKTKVWMTDSQKKAWSKFNILLKAGWLDEAQEELRSLGKFYSRPQQMTFAKVWAAALGYRQAIHLAGQSIGAKDRLKDSSYVAMTFPQEFIPMVKKRSSEYGISEKLLLSLIRQESAYDVRAVSRSNAKGLMQLMSPTAKEVAQKLSFKEFDPEIDLFNPETNIRLGSHYFSMMLKSFKDHVPMALAAYNAGPTRLRRWLSQRNLVSELTDNLSSRADSEIWLDEMPWSETRFYVKSILRNYLVYDMLDDGLAVLSDPIWK